LFGLANVAQDFLKKKNLRKKYDFYAFNGFFDVNFKFV